MAKEIKDGKGQSFTITKKEEKLFEELDKVVKVSRAEFFREVTVNAAKKVIAKSKSK